jgi:hypothetical protein
MRIFKINSRNYFPLAIFERFKQVATDLKQPDFPGLPPAVVAHLLVPTEELASGALES